MTDCGPSLYSPGMRRLCVAALLLASSVASANGRAPLTNGMHFQPGDTHSIFVATTFGFLISHDDGCTFNWICEADIGYGGTFDPKYAIAKTGTIYATTFMGLRASYDGGCSFSTVTMPVWVDALDVGPTGEVWAGTSETGTDNDLFSSINDGQTFQSKNLDSQTLRFKSVKVAPGDALRVYATSIDTTSTHFHKTIDGGATWTEPTLANVTVGAAPEVHVIAVDPTNEDLVYLVSVDSNVPGDRLYRSTDGGETFTDVLDTPVAIDDLVIHDATHVIVATATMSFESTDSGQTFSAMTDAPQLACLAQRDDGMLYGCGQNWEPDFKSVATSTDGSSWSKVFRFVELYGPLDCPAGTAETDTCAPGWPTVQQQFATTGPTCGANVQPDGPPASAPDGLQPNPSGGCCDAGTGGPTALVAGLGVLVVLRRRGRRK